MNENIKNSIIYNVYPTSFYDSNGDGIGDLNGIAQKLSYIKDFADIIWINPIFKSPFRDGGYDVEDYYAIDEKFGTMDDLDNLIKEAHKLGIKVLLDLVVGHTSDTHKWFLESSKHERNEYSDYYIWNNNTFDACPMAHISGNSERDGCYGVNFFCFQPALNFGFANPDRPWQNHYLDEPCLKIHEEVIKIIKFYLAKGVDGFRVDIASSIVKRDINGKHSCEVWRKIFGKVREEYPEAIFVSEWGQPMYAVQNGDFDIDFLTHDFNDGYNQLFRKESGANVISSEGHSFFRRDGKGEAATFFEYFLDNLAQIEGKGYISVVTGNHDLPRIALNRNSNDLKTAYALILALPNVPLIYYGDEIGLPYNRLKTKDGGYSRTGSRTPMQWSDKKNAGFSATDGEIYLPIDKNYEKTNVEVQSKDENSLINEVKKLVEIKRNNPELFSCGNEFELVSDTYPLIFKRKSKGETFICAINPSEREYTANFNVKETLSSLNALVKNDSIVLKPISYIWAKI